MPASIIDIPLKRWIASHLSSQGKLHHLHSPALDGWQDGCWLSVISGGGVPAELAVSGVRPARVPTQ